MGFRGSRVQIPPSRLSEDQALQPLRLWGFFFVAPRAVSNAVSFYRLTIRCVGCNTTFLIVSASTCWYDVISTSSVFQPPAAATSFTGYPFRSVAHFRRIGCHIPRRRGTILARPCARRSHSSKRCRLHDFVGSFGDGNTGAFPIAACAFCCARRAARTLLLIGMTSANPFLSCSAHQ